MHRQAIHRGRVSYEPNSLAGGCPFQAGAAGFVSFPEPRVADDHKVRGKAERFADHYTQATLFWNSQTATEKQHIVNAFRFELTRVQTPAVRERMVAGLRCALPGRSQRSSFTCMGGDHHRPADHRHHGRRRPDHPRCGGGATRLRRQRTVAHHRLPTHARPLVGRTPEVSRVATR